jgi:hypothetical protein
MGVSAHDTTQKGLGYMLEDLHNPGLFCALVKPQFLARICVAFLLGGLNVCSPINITNESLLCYFDGTLGKDTVDRISRQVRLLENISSFVLTLYSSLPYGYLTQKYRR